MSVIGELGQLIVRGVGRFEANPRVELLPTPPNATVSYTRVLLLEAFVYHTCAGGPAITVPAGLISDGASIPPLLQLRLGHPLSSMNAPFGLIHDYLYRSGARTKDEADLLAFDMARCRGHHDVDAFEIYSGLQIGGAAAWEENARKRAVCGADIARLLAWA